MIRIAVTSEKDNAVEYLEIQEGNIDFGAGMKCIVNLVNNEGHEIGRRLFRLEGAPFQKWIAQPDGHRVLVGEVCKLLGVTLVKPTVAKVAATPA